MENQHLRTVFCARSNLFRNLQSFIFKTAILSLQLNRSDSDSAMPLYRRSSSTAMPFKRNSVERRSLRWSRPLGQGSLKHHRNSFVQAVPRTSIDLELDLQAQHTRLQSLRDEISRLKSLKTRLETAKEKGDAEIAAWVLEDAQFQNLVSQVSYFHTSIECCRLFPEYSIACFNLFIAKSFVFGFISTNWFSLYSQADSKSEEEKKIDKLLKKTSREIYKLRKSKAGSGKPDVISFK